MYLLRKLISECQTRSRSSVERGNYQQFKEKLKEAKLFFFSPWTAEINLLHGSSDERDAESYSGHTPGSTPVSTVGSIAGSVQTGPGRNSKVQLRRHSESNSKDGW